MRLPKFLKIFCLSLMTLMLSHLPQVAFAETHMISTSEVLRDLDRAQAQKNVQEFLSRVDVREQLIKNGISPQEASQRLATLSESELRQLSHQMDQVRAGGDILVVVLIVVLIIFLAERI